MICPGDDENASVTGGTGKIAVLEYVAVTIYARACAIPCGGDPIDTSFAIGSDLLRAPDRGGRQILIDRRLQADGWIDKLARPGKGLIQRAQRRTAITGYVNCGIQALFGPPTLFELAKIGRAAGGERVWKDV